MRFVSVLCLMALCISSVAMADPANVEPKEWHWVFSGDRAIIPEQEPNDTCPGQQMACGDIIEPAYLDAGNFDWYTWTANAGDQMTMGTDAYQGSSVDTYIELYANDCATLLAQDDDSGPGLFSLITNFAAPYTGVYNLKVRGYNTSSSGPYKFFLNCGTPPPPPVGDTCADATGIERCTTGSLNGNTSNYRNDYNPPTGCTGFSANGKDVVYYMDLQVGDEVSMTYTQLQYDTSFYVVTNCVNLDCIAGADDTLTGEPEVIQFTAAVATRYYVILDAWGTDVGGPWTLDYTINCPVPPEPEACCFPDGSCQMLLAADCNAQGGDPMGQGTNCDTVNCEIVPNQTTTWGQIKSNYR